MVVYWWFNGDLMGFHGISWDLINGGLLVV